MSVSQEELLAVMARDFPLQYQISMLTAGAQAQARRIAHLEGELAAAKTPAPEQTAAAVG